MIQNPKADILKTISGFQFNDRLISDYLLQLSASPKSATRDLSDLWQISPIVPLCFISLHVLDNVLYLKILDELVNYVIYLIMQDVM